MDSDDVRTGREEGRLVVRRPKHIDTISSQRPWKSHLIEPKRYRLWECSTLLGICGELGTSRGIRVEEQFDFTYVRRFMDDRLHHAPYTCPDTTLELANVYADFHAGLSRCLMDDDRTIRASSVSVVSGRATTNAVNNQKGSMMRTMMNVFAPMPWTSMAT